MLLKFEWGLILLLKEASKNSYFDRSQARASKTLVTRYLHADRKSQIWENFCFTPYMHISWGK